MVHSPEATWVIVGELKKKKKVSPTYLPQKFSLEKLELTDPFAQEEHRIPCLLLFTLTAIARKHKKRKCLKDLQLQQLGLLQAENGARATTAVLQSPSPGPATLGSSVEGRALACQVSSPRQGTRVLPSSPWRSYLYQPRDAPTPEALSALAPWGEAQHLQTELVVASHIALCSQGMPEPGTT